MPGMMRSASSASSDPDDCMDWMTARAREDREWRRDCFQEFEELRASYRLGGSSSSV